MVSAGVCSGSGLMASAILERQPAERAVRRVRLPVAGDHRGASR